MNSLLIFILLYLVLNYSFAIIQFLLYPRSINFYDFRQKHLKPIDRLVNGSKIFKLISDLAILFSMAIVFKDLIPKSVIFHTIYLSISFLYIYTIYLFSMNRIYNTMPNFTLDAKLLKLGLRIIFHGYRHYLFLAIIVLILFQRGLYIYIEYMLDMLYQLPQINTVLYSLCFIISLSLLTIVLDKSIWNHAKKNIHSIVYLILGNTKQSLDAKKTLKRISSQGIGYSDPALDSFSMKEKPNIIFLFIESYGSILYDKYHDDYKSLIIELEKKIDKNKTMHSVSNLTNAPKSGGGSWLCYSSFLYGILIEHEIMFRYLITSGNKKKMNKSILGILKDKGYQNFMINPLTGFKNLYINWQEILDFFSLKDVIKFEDLGYKGSLVGALGRQPPDQYSLHKGYDIIKQKSKGKPFTVFFETLNSHATWQSPIELEKDLDKLNNSSYEYKITKQGDSSYFPAMKYQITNVIDFIDQKIDDNSIVFVIGDHQPPLVTDEDSGYETPIHIISKNKSFLNHFKEYGFEDGLWVNERKKDNVYHQGLYYSIIRSLIKDMGEEKDVLPNYLKKGITIK